MKNRDLAFLLFLVFCLVAGTIGVTGLMALVIADMKGPDTKVCVCPEKK